MIFDLGPHQFRESLRELLRELRFFVLLKSRDAIPRMVFWIPRITFLILRVAPRIPRNSPRAPRMAFSLRERFDEIGVVLRLQVNFQIARTRDYTNKFPRKYLCNGSCVGWEEQQKFRVKTPPHPITQHNFWGMNLEKNPNCTHNPLLRGKTINRNNFSGLS